MARGLACDKMGKLMNCMYAEWTNVEQQWHMARA